MFIDAAFKVWNNILRVPLAMEKVIRLEEAFGLNSPLNNVYTLESLAIKTKTLEPLLWCLDGIHDLLAAKFTSPSELTLRAMTGKNCGGKGLIDLLMYKEEVAKWITTGWVESHNIEAEAKLLLHRCMLNYTEYRKQFGQPHAPADEMLDMSFLSLLAPSSQTLIGFVEAT